MIENTATVDTLQPTIALDGLGGGEIAASTHWRAAYSAYSSAQADWERMQALHESERNAEALKQCQAELARCKRAMDDQFDSLMEPATAKGKDGGTPNRWVPVAKTPARDLAFTVLKLPLGYVWIVSGTNGLGERAELARASRFHSTRAGAAAAGSKALKALR